MSDSSVRAAQAATDGLWEWNPTTERLWFCADFARLVGLPAEETVDSLEPWTSRLHPVDAEGLVRALSDCQAGLGDIDQSFRLRLPEGEFRWFQARGVSRTNEIGETVASGGIQDIHAERQAQEELRERDQQLLQRQRMEAIDCLAGGIAHEFNNVLQAVSGYVGFARAALQPDTQPHEDLTQALVAADRAARLTRDLLDFARADEVCEGEVDANDIIVGLVDLLRPVLGEDIELRLNRWPDPMLVGANVLELRQALLNLCINARDAMPSGGGLCVSAEPFHCSPAHQDCLPHLTPGDYCRVRITDTGCGISPENQARVFDPFFTTKAAGEGTGLGLAAVYGFVQRSGGQVSVYSEGEGEGTAFCLYLPVKEGSCMTDTTTDASASRDRQPTTLLVEDDPLVREVGRRVLEGAGHRVLCAADGEAALETYIENAEQISLVLLDVVLPRLSGRKVFEQIRRLQSNVPIVFCTGYDPGSVQGDGLGESGDAVLSKPFDASRLLSTIGPLLDNPA